MFLGCIRMRCPFLLRIFLSKFKVRGSFRHTDSMYVYIYMYLYLYIFLPKLSWCKANPTQWFPPLRIHCCDYCLQQMGDSYVQDPAGAWAYWQAIIPHTHPLQYYLSIYAGYVVSVLLCVYINHLFTKSYMFVLTRPPLSHAHRPCQDLDLFECFSGKSRLSAAFGQAPRCWDWVVCSVPLD